MPSSRQKYNFYAVTNGREVGVYTNWTQTGDAVLGYAKAKYKGFSTYGEAAEAMISSGFNDFNIFDGHITYSKLDFENKRDIQLDENVVDNDERIIHDDDDKCKFNAGYENDDFVDLNSNDNHFRDTNKKETEMINHDVTKNSTQEQCGKVPIPQVSWVTYTTPKKIKHRDKNETPVPGSINGSATYLSLPKKKNAQKKLDDSTSEEKVINGDKQIVVMKNIELILQSIVAELHELRQDHGEFKREMKEHIEEIKERQQNVEESISGYNINILEALKENAVKTDGKKQGSPKKDQTSDLKKEMTASIANLQKDFGCNVQSLTTTLQTVEKSLGSIKADVVLASEECKVEFQKIGTRNKQIQDSMLDIKDGIDKSNNSISDIEKSLNTLTDNSTFIIPSKTSKINVKEFESSVITENRYSVLNDQTDFEKTKYHEEQNTKVEPDKSKICVDITHDYKDEGPNVKNQREPMSDHKPPRENGYDNRNRKSFTKKEMVYLMGDSISGQVNPVVLGKSTNSFVKKLKAPKIEDIKELSSNTKDAKVVIIHTGINNLKERKSVNELVSNLVEAVTSIKESSPDSKVVLSKVTPVGNRELDIDRTLFNAESEKKLREIYKSDITFVDHSNFADQGLPIDELYRNDMIHLSKNGVLKFKDNIEHAINSILDKGKRRESSNEGYADERKDGYRKDRKFEGDSRKQVYGRRRYYQNNSRYNDYEYRYKYSSRNRNKNYNRGYERIETDGFREFPHNDRYRTRDWEGNSYRRNHSLESAEEREGNRCHNCSRVSERPRYRN